ncbi:MAG: hypothetical protein [Wigfec virus K19_83]|nr:MAG: hypothetical protein [Wigfec virus K19_83]
MALKDFAGAITTGLGAIGGWLGIGEARQDKRQIKQQGKLNELNAETSKELADYEQALKLKMWKDTNYGAQLEQAGLAGISKAAAIGGSGTGTQGASVSGVGGGSAADAASTTNARTAQMQAGMQLASQLALQKAQKENIEADTQNKLAGATGTEAGTEGQKIENEIASRTKESRITEIQERAYEQIAKTANEAIKQNINEETKQAQIKSAQETLINQILKNKGETIENRKKQAELSIAKFEAKMAESGISPKTPWYIKLITDLADKHGLNILK